MTSGTAIGGRSHAPGGVPKLSRRDLSKILGFGGWKSCAAGVPQPHLFVTASTWYAAREERLPLRSPLPRIGIKKSPERLLVLRTERRELDSDTLSLLRPPYGAVHINAGQLGGIPNTNRSLVPTGKAFFVRRDRPVPLKSSVSTT